MKFSVTDAGKNQGFKTVETDDFSKFATHITFYNYSMATFKGGDRKNKNFERVDGVALDFDDSLSINEARMRFAKYKHIIAPTRNHQKEKHGVVCDRFRVIIPLTESITNVDDYRETIKHLLRENPEADKACKDPARMFYPSIKVEVFKEEGEAIKPRRYVPKEKKETKPLTGDKGALLSATMSFLLFGAPAGERNHTLFAAAKDMQGQGYSIEETTAAIADMVKRTGNWGHPELVEKDIETIENAFREETNDEVREKKKSTFDFKPIGELFKQDVKVSWLVKDLLIESGISLLAAQPKSGKSTLVRQLAKAVCQGEMFLNRPTRKGKVAYLALEEHPGMLKKQFKSIGVNEGDDILIHVGPIYSQAPEDDLIKFLKDYDATMVVIDTLALFVGLNDMNSYDEVNKAMAKVRRIARETGCHVVLIHHTNKSPNVDLNSIMGSQAFLGAVDAALIINKAGDRRYLTSTGRGLQDFKNCEIIFDKKTESYTLGMEVDSEF